MNDLLDKIKRNEFGVNVIPLSFTDSAYQEDIERRREGCYKTDVCEVI